MHSKLAGYGVIGIFCFICNIAARDSSLLTKPGEDAQGKTFKAKTELVEVHAVVTDHKGRIVENLRKEDFELLENNQPQEISFFSLLRVEDEPYSNAARPDKIVRPKTLRQRLSEAPARATVLYVDNLHLSFSSLNWVKQQLHRFIDENMTMQDSIALVASSSIAGVAQQFTRDKRALHYAIDQIAMGPIAIDRNMTGFLAGRIALGDRNALEEGKKILAAEGIDDKYGSMTRARASLILDEQSYLRESTVVMLKAVIEQVIGMPGQRMIAVFSEGFTQHGRDGWPKYEEVRSVINRAARSGVAIYSIDAKGLDATVGGNDPYGFAAAAEHEKLDGLVALAKDTGGEMYMNTNNLGGALSQAFDANRSYYILAYYLAPGGEDLKFRSIKVRVRNHPEYHVRTPKGFSPDDATKTPEVIEDKTPQKRFIRDINSIMPQTSLNVSARMDFLEAESDNRQVSLTVCFDGDSLQYKQLNQRQVMDVEILYSIFDSSGRRVDALSINVEGTLTAERAANGRSNGYLFIKRLALKPGVYQARVGVRETGSELTGTATAWVEVPDLTHDKLALSDVMLLDSLPAGDAIAGQSNADGLKPVSMVQGVRIYPHNNACGYFIRVYRNLKTPRGSDLELKTELLEGGKIIRSNSWTPVEVNSNDLDSKGRVDINGKIDLKGLDPGVYELSVSIRDSQLNKIAQRTAVFGVE